MMKTNWSKPSAQLLVASLFLLASLIGAYFLMARSSPTGYGQDAASRKLPGRTASATTGQPVNRRQVVDQPKTPPFSPTEEFQRQHNRPNSLPWTPFRDLHLAPQVAEGMQLQPDQVEQVKSAVERFLETAGLIQAEDAYYSINELGNHIIILVPKKEKWQDVGNRLEEDLIAAVGTEKAKYFLDSSKDHLDLVTGKSGNTTRSIEVEDIREKFGFQLDYGVKIQSGQMVLLSNSRHFTPDDRKNFGRIKESEMTLGIAELSFPFEKTPAFLKPIIQIIRELEASDP